MRLPDRRLLLLGTLAAACLLAVIGGRRVLLDRRQAVPAAVSALRPPTRLTRLEQTGARLYASVCAYCHGVDGDGFGLNSSNLTIPPRDHTDSAYIGSLDDDHLFKVIKFGGASQGKSALMPPWGGRFSDREIAALVAYLRTLSRQPQSRE